MIKNSNIQNFQNEILHFESIKKKNDDLGEKYGEIYKNGSSIIFRCEFCLQIFQQLSNFLDHIQEHVDKDDGFEERCSPEIISLKDSDTSSISNFGMQSEVSDEFELQHKSETCVTKSYFKQKGWKIERIFKSEKAMENFISTENTWSLKKKFYTKKGCKKYFRCNKVRSRGEACAMKLMTFKNNFTDKSILYRSKTNHTCDNIPTKGGRGNKLLSPLADEIKREVEKEYQKGTKIKAIVEYIEEIFGSNKSNQVKRYIKILQLNQEVLLKDEILSKWIEPSIEIPAEEKEPFVANYEIINSSLRFFISSKFLLKNMLNVNHVNFIGTKKITWQYYVIYLVGATINENKFLCFGIAVCKKDQIQDFEFIFRTLIKCSLHYLQIDFQPNYLCRDSNEDLEVAFKNVYPLSKTKICWDHVSKCIKKKLEDLLPNQLKKEEIMNEISQIQKCETEFDFETKANIFLDNWAIFVEFTTYFHNNWVIKNRNWYAGVDNSFTSTNKPMDFIVKEIENDHTLRTKLPMENFKEKILELISKFSYLSTANIEVTKIENDIKLQLKTSISMTKTQEIVPVVLAQDLVLAQSYEILKPKKKKNTSYKSHIIPNIKYNLNSKSDLKKKCIDKMWREEATFNSFVEAERAIEIEQTWGFMTKSKSKSGIKRYYRCNRVPSRGKSCESGLYLFLKADSTEVVLVRSGLPHTCHEIPCKNRGLNEEVRTEIKRLTELNWKTKQIYDYLLENNFTPMPSKVQINNYIGVVRERKFNASSPNVNEIDNWLRDNSTVPECESKMFVVSYETNIENFKFFISSIKLLQNVIEMETLNMDNIRKIEWLKYPVYILATTDNQNKCKCLGIAVLSEESLENFEYIFKAIKDSSYKFLKHNINPTILMTDSNFNIQLAFRNVFGSSVKIKICWDIVKKSVRKSLEELKFKRETICNIIRDLDFLHRSNTLEEFNENVKNFEKKWQSYKEFFMNFYDAWIRNNNSWYQGYGKTPCTSNTRLDNFVKSIRNDQLYRKKISLNDFGNILAKSIECWSFESESRYVC